MCGCIQQAAGIFNYLKGNVLMAVHQEPTPDLSPDALHALAQLMLAQAQEVIAYKCIRGAFHSPNRKAPLPSH